MDQIGVIEKFENTVESVKNSDKSSTLMESKNSDCDASNLFPITPYLTEEKVNFASRLKIKSDDDNPSTPMEDVFDPCDAGHTCLHPKQMNNLGTSVSRKLNFTSNESVSKNGALMETVYESVLEAIIYKQAEDILAEIVGSDSSQDVFKTPPAAVRAVGLAKKCPGAPLKKKPARNKRAVDMSYCRKLDFDSCI